MSRPAFRAAPLRVRVPATSANLGPGFDSFALALERFDDLVAQVVDEPGVRVDIGGEGADLLPRDGKHLVAKVMRRAFEVMGGQPRGLDLVCANRIPHKRGLGSSAAAIVGGLVLARALVVGGDDLLPDERLLSMAASMEGHPDNAAACLHGGFTISWMQQETAHALRLTAHPSVRPVALIPSTTSSTRRTRGLLPDQVPHADAAFTAARAGLLVHALTNDPSLLLQATDERLHQQQRREAYPRSVNAVAQLRERGIPAVISGAGPTVLALVTDGVLEATLAEIKDVARDRFEIAALAVDASGASVLPLT
jgi:homoserine kinase